MQWIIGDIHGCLHTLTELIEGILREDATPKFYFVGDYVDRGLYSKQTIDFLLQLRTRYPCYFCRGNHDDIIVHLLGLPSISYWGNYARSAEPMDVIEWAKKHGLDKTFLSYYPEIVASNWCINNKFDGWFAADFPEHFTFFRDLNMFIETDEFFVTHAAPPAITDLSRLNQDEYNRMIWERKWFSDIDDGASQEDSRIYHEWGCKPWFVGHTPTQNMETRPRGEIFVIDKWKSVKFIDTGSFLRRRQGGISAYCWERKSAISVRTHAKDIGE